MLGAARMWTVPLAAGLALTAALPVSQAAQPTGTLAPRSQRASARPAVAQPAGCCSATAADSPKLGGDYGDQDFSSLTQIGTGTIGRLRGSWLHHFTEAASDPAQESTAAAVGGDLYVQTSQGQVVALNGATGKVLWTYNSGYPGTERGVAVGNGVVYSALGGEHVVALNQKTGALLWQTQVGTPGQDTGANGSQTPWTLYFRGLVLVGTENGGGSGMRGHVYALRAGDGTLAWKFASTDPGSPGHRTWSGNSWRLGGGDAWMPPAVDPQLGLIYMTLANPEPRTLGAARAGRNLYTNSVVALRWNTGQVAWHFQSVHHDLWDYDNEMAPVIASIRYGSGVRTVVIYGSKTAYLYYLDAKTGAPVVRVRERPVPQLAAQATSPTQPIPAGDSLVPTCPQRTGSTQVIPGFRRGCEFTPYRNKPVMVTPGRGGGGNWAPLSFDRRTGLLYDAASETDAAFSSGQPYGQPTFWAPAGERRGGVLDAVDPRTNTIVWQRNTTYPLANGDGVLTTAGGLLFEGSPDGNLYARSAATGKILWHWQTGTSIATTPVTYLAGGRQYVAVLACGGNVPCNLWSLRLGGHLSPAKAQAKPPLRFPVAGPQLAGSAVADTVVLGRTWDTVTNAPSVTEDLGSEIAMAPPVLVVQAGARVKFENPAGNSRDHCARSFFDPASFSTGPLAPGQAKTVRFSKRGTYFYNDCAGFPWDTGEVIVR
ncbi:MAG TPA: PQQ-binding-like beta-propeller repeat protein [Streptosporangiaceae bacterium]